MRGDRRTAWSDTALSKVTLIGSEEGAGGDGLDIGDL